MTQFEEPSKFSENKFTVKFEFSAVPGSGQAPSYYDYQAAQLGGAAEGYPTYYYL